MLGSIGAPFSSNALEILKVARTEAAISQIKDKAIWLPGQTLKNINC